jgi:hypothetical protein
MSRFEYGAAVGESEETRAHPRGQAAFWLSGRLHLSNAGGRSRPDTSEQALFGFPLPYLVWNDLEDGPTTGAHLANGVGGTPASLMLSHGEQIRKSMLKPEQNESQRNSSISRKAKLPSEALTTLCSTPAFRV